MKLAPLCRFCGGKIAKRTVTNYVATKREPYHQEYPGFSRYIYVDALPISKAECQKLTNATVVSVSRHHDSKTVARFGSWDGESYVDRFFCNGDHARLFGYACAASNRGTTEYIAARAKQHDAR